VARYRQERGAVTRKGRDMWAGRCRCGMAAVVVLALAMAPSHGQVSPAPKPATEPAAHVLRIVFFHSLTCNECRKVKRMLDRILKPWVGRARVEWKSTGDIQVFRELLLYDEHYCCLLYTSPSPRDRTRSRMPSSA